MPALTPVALRVDWGLLAFFRTEEKVGVVGDDTVFPKKGLLAFLLCHWLSIDTIVVSMDPVVLPQAGCNIVA